MSTRLIEISDSVRQLIEAMKPLIQFDLSVVDENLMRIAGTGRYENYVGLVLPTRSASDYVISHGQPLIIYNPLEHEVCQTCTVRNICLKEASILYPIHKDDEVIGIITIASFREEDKDKLKQMERDLLSFLKNIAEFIAVKVKETEKQKRMDTILNTVNEGIILTDHTGHILLCNTRMEQAGVRAGGTIRTLLPEFTVSRMMQAEAHVEEWPCELKINDRYEAYMVTVKSVQPGNPKSDMLLRFKEQDTGDLRRASLPAEKEHVAVLLERIKGRSQLLEEAKQIAYRAAGGSSNVLIQGESGTGKELFARAIHQMSDRAGGPFIAVNCAAIPENLLESELFGYEDGAFTGAKKGGKPGKFELADNGTIFLDEIGDLTLHLQPKLLRALECGQVERVGGVSPVALNVRVVAATNQDLERMIEQGKFREDLYYRLNVINIQLPPLRKRREDVMLLAQSFLGKYNRTFGKKIRGFTDGAEQLLLLYRWPGNVRELENAIEYAVHVEQSDVIGVASLPAKIRYASTEGQESAGDSNLKQIEKATIQRLLSQYGDHLEGKRKVASQLGISLSTLYRRLRAMNE